MKKITIFLMLLISLTVMASCQTQYASPQTVEWDVPDGVASGYYTLINYEAEVIHTFGDKENEADYLPIGTGLTIEEALVDLGAQGYQGVFIVAIRANVVRASDGSSVEPERAFSDVVADIDTETFYVVLEPGMKVKRIRIK